MTNCCSFILLLYFKKSLQGDAVDIEKELQRLHKKQQKLESNRQGLSCQLERLEAKGKGGIPKAIQLKEKVCWIDLI